MNKEKKVGEQFEHEGVKLIVKEGHCSLCYFIGKLCNIRILQCVGMMREDNKSVYFEEVKEDKTNNSSMKILDKIIEKFERKIEKEKSKSDDKKNYQKIDYLKESLDELQLLTHVIVLNNVEQRSKLTRVLSAEHLIQQLPKEHQGRNSWLLNYGVEEESIQMRVSRNLLFDETTQSCELAGQ
jgi:hypothetical protein